MPDEMNESEIFKKITAEDEVPTIVGKTILGDLECPIIFIDYSQLPTAKAESYEMHLLKEAPTPCFDRFLLMRTAPDTLHLETEDRTLTVGLGRETHHLDSPHWWADCECSEKDWNRFSELLEKMGFWVLFFQCRESSILFFVDRSSGSVQHRLVRPRAEIRQEKWA